jgi:hypothetical protein
MAARMDSNFVALDGRAWDRKNRTSQVHNQFVDCQVLVMGWSRTLLKGGGK